MTPDRPNPPGAPRAPRARRSSGTSSNSSGMNDQSLFAQAAEDIQRRSAPLPDRIRPRDLSEYFGQDELVGTGKILRTMIEQDRITSM
ncbi:MAG TPA: hypothetical protein VL860_08965, partial [Planctomycetota bacterium]|nr:hypothetical protein [Planctomycetota bacterium]